ncbi:MAG: GTPase ObgE, partial [Candidatus Omnitrophica bacterium]|nr:GTPase ObgE [Candidatus Omnitrophota bacterium]
MFIDTAKVNVKAGNGGNGVNCFYTDKLTRPGHPDGGDGGKGGDVIIRVSHELSGHTLIDFQYRQHFKAHDGKHGSGKKKKGADGDDSVILVPPGTLIFDNDTNMLVADLVKNSEEIVIAAGGEGGKGNRSHKDATQGSLGEERKIRLELKLIADVGIIGFPNAGKSTLISKISNAHPKIAAYPFTTKNPVLGVVRTDDLEFTAVEVPGLMEGAHRGIGLGDLFLRHIERTRLLVHLVDIGENTKDASDDYKNINEELRLYGKGLARKPRIVAA